MPIKESAKKELRKNTKRMIANLGRKRKVKETLTKIRKSAVSGSLDEGKKIAKDAVKLLDKAAKLNIMHPNKAARLKSRMMKKLNKK